MKISSKNIMFNKGAIMQKLLVVPALGMLLAGCNPSGGTSTAVSSNEGFSAYCPSVGVADSQCVLNDPENPYANLTVDATTKYTFANAATNDRGAFYVWATAQASEQSGENQYQTAASLHALYDDTDNAAAKEQAILAYKSVLDNYYTDATEGVTPIAATDVSYTLTKANICGDAWSFDTAYDQDLSISNVIYVTSNWCWGVPYATFSIMDIPTSTLNNYDNLEFKVKWEDSTQMIIKIPDADVYAPIDNAQQSELFYTVADFPEVSGAPGWRQVTIPLSDFVSASQTHDDLAAFTEIQINEAWSTDRSFLVTDIVLTGDATGNGLVGDTNGDNLVTIYKSDNVPTPSNYRDLVGENLVEPASLDNLYDDAAAATTALSGWGFSYDTATNSLTSD